jgi:hypothetical protein
VAGRDRRERGPRAELESAAASFGAQFVDVDVRHEFRRSPNDLCREPYGYPYRSDDDGASWTKLRRELSEIAAVCWVAN